MADQPNPTPQQDEVEAHRRNFVREPSQEAADVDAHALRRRDEGTPAEKPTGAEEQAEDDVEAHRRNFRHQPS